MNILHISGVKNWGGGENHIENLYVELQVNHLEVNQHVLCVKHGKFHQILKEKGNFNYIPASLAIKMDLRFVLKIIKTCRLKKIDLVHIHDPTALTLCVIADRITGTLPPFVYSKKTSFPIKNRKSTLFKYNYKKIKKIICVSNATEKVASQSIEDESKLITIYNGIRFDNKTKETAFKLRDKYSISSDTLIVGHIGNHIRAKNLVTFIEVINELINVRKIKKIHFVQIGMFTDRTQTYFDLIEKYSLEKFVTFTGFMDNASAFLSQFDIFLLTSQSEGLPQVINEAFYFKIPVVSTNVGGIPEIIKNGENGFLADVGDSKKLSDHIINMMSDEKLINGFVKKSHNQLMENFSTVNMAESTLKLYKSIIKLYGLRK